MEDKVTYTTGDQLTFRALVKDLEKIRALQEQVQKAFDQARASYPSLASDAHMSEIDEHTIKALARYDDIIREYQQRNEQAEKITKENRKADEYSRSILNNREKPWLPYHDGE